MSLLIPAGELVECRTNVDGRTSNSYCLLRCLKSINALNLLPFIEQEVRPADAKVVYIYHNRGSPEDILGPDSTGHRADRWHRNRVTDSCGYPVD
jgi:hypothetical protein